MGDKWMLVRAGVDDADRLADLAARTFPMACPTWMAPTAIQDHIDKELSAAVFQTDLADPLVEVWIAESEAGAALGYVMTVDGAAPLDEAAELADALLLQRIYVDRLWHGSGVAQALLARAEEVAREHGHSGLCLGTSRENERALAFYLRHGFVIVGERTFTVGGVANADHVLVKPLAEVHG